VSRTRTETTLMTC